MSISSGPGAASFRDLCESREASPRFRFSLVPDKADILRRFSDFDEMILLISASENQTHQQRLLTMSVLIC